MLKNVQSRTKSNLQHFLILLIRIIIKRTKGLGSSLKGVSIGDPWNSFM